jgi:hypothetical protein
MSKFEPGKASQRSRGDNAARATNSGLHDQSRRKTAVLRSQGASSPHQGEVLRDSEPDHQR